MFFYIYICIYFSLQDFRGLYDQDSDDSWKTFLENILRLTDVEELIFEKVPPYVIKKIADSLPQLRKLICYCMSSIFTEPEIWYVVKFSCISVN